MITTESNPLLSQAGYMKSTEFASVRGVSGVIVSLHAAVLLAAAKRDFIWYLQGLSLKDGGLKRVARELVEMFPDRLGTEAMHKARVAPEKMYPGELVSSVGFELDFGRWNFSEEKTPTKKGSELIQLCRHQALTYRERTKNSDGFCPPRSFKVLSVEQFLIELCTNPKLQFSLPGVDSVFNEFEVELAVEENPELSPGDFKHAEMVYFRDIIGALVEYRARHEKKIRANFPLTAIGKKIWETLAYVLASRNMVLLDGLEGRGKTEAVKAWCELHPGQARFVSLKGVANKTTAFREMAHALGITYGYGRTGPEMQSRVEDVLNRSKIMLVIDEAHFLFNQTRRMTARPELIDWIDTAICNRGIGLALVTTPQFIACMARAKNQVEWNFNQFRRRVKRWVKLPEKNSEADIAAVARKIFQNAGEAVIKKVVGYALLSKRDLSAVGDVAAEIRAMLGTDNLGKVSVEHVHRAISDFLIPSDQAFKVSLDAAESAQRKTNRRPAPVPLEILGDESDLVEPSGDSAIAEDAEAPATPRTCGGLAFPARGSDHPAKVRASLEAVLTAH